MATVGSFEVRPGPPAQGVAQSPSAPYGEEDTFPIDVIDAESWDLPSFDEWGDADLFLNKDHRLWNFETYPDRHGKHRLRRVLRFIYNPPCRDELGVVTEAHAEALENRKGRGRWKSSREDAGALRPLALTVAKYHRRTKGRRNRGEMSF